MQKKWILVGSVAYFAAALVDYRWIRWLGIPLYAVSLGLMVLAMQADDEVHRLSLAGLSFQPAQLGVTSGIIMIAWLMHDLPKIHASLRNPFFRIAIIGVVSAVPFLLVMKMGDMGSALVWIPVVIVALLVAGIPFRFLSFIAFVSAGILPILYFVILPLVSERGPDRIDLWLRMMQGQEVDIRGDGYAPHNVSMAVGKAGWKGVGWKATAADGSLHDKKFIPHLTAHNDFIFAVIAEELGFRGALLLLGSFALLLIQGLFIGFYSRDVAGRLIVCMVVALIFAHVYENIGMGLEEIELGSAIHAAKFLGGDDGKCGGDPVVEGKDSSRLLVGEGAAFDQGGALAEAAVGRAAFEESEDPGESGEDQAAEEYFGGNGCGIEEKHDEGGDHRQDSKIVEAG
eukprot:g4195.t1